jgi:hypothetical protein
MQFIAKCGIEYGFQFVARLCRLPKQEPAFSSVPQTAFIEEKLRNLTKLQKYFCLAKLMNAYLAK